MEPEKIGKFIAELRKEKKMTQDDLAQVLYTDRSIISKWERGLYVPKYDIILKLSNIFDVSVNELYYGERQTNDNKHQVNEVTINIIKDSRKRIKKITILSLIFIILLIMSFFIYYFVNTYKSIRVYKISGESEKFGVYDGIFVVSKEKSYIQLGNINTLNGNVIENIKLYYKKNNDDYIIFTNQESSKLLTNNFGYSELYSYEDLKYIKEDLYLEIIFNGGQKDIIDLDVKADFINNNLFPENDSKISSNEVEELNDDIPKYIRENFELDSSNEKYYLEEIKENFVVKQTYYYSAKLYVVEEVGSTKDIRFEYFYPNDISYETGDGNIFTYSISEKKCTTLECDQSIIEYFINEYINKINFNE